MSAGEPRKVLASLTRADLPEGKPSYVLYPPSHIVVVRVGDEVFALESVCSHGGASLLLGRVSGEAITCRAHGYRFDLRSGRLLSPEGDPCSQRPFPVVREGDRWLVLEPAP